MHSPTPWEIDEQSHFPATPTSVEETITRVGYRVGSITTHVGYLNQFERADELHVVKCVNAHDDLLSALTNWTEWAVNRDIPFELISKTRAAIAKATK